MALASGPLGQRSPTFLAPGTGFVEGNFSTDKGWGDSFGMTQSHYIQAHLLLCGTVHSRSGPVPVRGPQVGDPGSTQAPGRPFQVNTTL